MDYILQLNEFFVEGGNQEKSHVLLHISEPSTPEEEKKGYFFIICETNGMESKSLLKLQEVIDIVESGYYSTPETDDKNALEITLEKVNAETFSLVKENPSLHCVIGAIRPPEVILSFYGNPQAVLFYKNRDGEYKRMDLVAENKNEDDKPSAHLFSQIVQGKISSNDYLFIGTSNIVNYFSPDRLTKIITSRPTRQSAEHLERVLAELRNGLSFGGMVIHLNETPSSPEEATKIAALTGENTVNELFLTEQKTENTLSPSLMTKLNSKIQSLETTLTEKNILPRSASGVGVKAPGLQKTEVSSAHLRPHRPLRAPDEKLSFWSVAKSTAQITWKVLVFILKFIVKLLQGILYAIKFLFTFLFALFFVITNIQNRRRNILDNWSRSWQNFKQGYERLPMISKIFALLLVAAAVTITVSIVYAKDHQKKAAAENVYQETLKQITTKRDAAESALIYNDTAVALNEVNAAKLLFESLPCADEQRKSDCEKLQEQIDVLTNKIRRVTKIKPQLLMNWTDLAAEGEIKSIFKINNKVIGYGQTNGTLFIYDLLSKENKLLPAGYNALAFTGSSVPKENDYALLLFNKKELLKYKPENDTVEKIDVSYPADDADIKSAVVYNRRLYTLDVSNSKIYKHDNINTGFGLGKDWLKDIVNIKDSYTMAIDGDIFVLSNTGKITRFVAGIKQDFNIQGLDPALTHGGEIWTYNDLQYIYILDSEEARLIILDKNGQLKKQIMAEELAHPTGMVIDEGNHVGYILDSNKLYQIELP